MARSYSTGSRGANKVRASAGPTNPSVGSAPAIEPFIEGGLGLSPAELKTFAGSEIFDSASDTTVEVGGKTYTADFDIRFAMTDVEDGEEGEKEPTLIKTSVTELRDSTGKAIPNDLRAQLMNQTDFRTALDEEINATFQKSMVEAGNYNLAKKVGKLAG